MLEKINIRNIITNHLDSLKNHNTKKSSFDDWLTFFWMPVFVACIFCYFKVTLSNDAINIIITSLSILIGLLINVIVLIFDMIKRDNKNKIKNELLRELLSNISFTILLSIFLIGTTLATFIRNSLIKSIATFLVFLLLSNFILTILMILKRMHTLFRHEIDEIENG
jgi:hypothetical protein